MGAAVSGSRRAGPIRLTIRSKCYKSSFVWLVWLPTSFGV